ncbi:uncharacterized protein LOC122074759 [Macadamia integrifolia]|uniref:uncharacterized protein LOC122074759 n=1 Tax=Macadamia integrifolia TaxID=60698 RepID=UPI001C4EF1C2|nr:uncharacterized protein LOC122074759 [Macadamia integrifolia]
MDSPQHFSFRNLLLLYLVFFLFSSILVCASSDKRFLGKRHLLKMEKEVAEEEEEEEVQPKKKFDLSTKKQTKPIKPKVPTNSTKSKTTILSKTKLKKLNSTSSISNSTKSNSVFIKKSSDLLKPSSPKNKTSQIIVTKKSGTVTEKKSSEEKNQQQKKIQKPTEPYLMDQDDEDEDIVSELKEDLQMISTTSKAYLTKANKEITKGFKPFVGNKYAPTIASILAFIFIIVPLLLVSLIFNRFKAYFSLQKLLIFIQVYLSIYFSILSLSSLVTGLEPLKFFYATSQSSYVCLQVLQTLGYVLYLLLLFMYLVVVLSKENGLGSKLLGLGQMMVGVAVGFHYYVTVFHWAVLRQPPKTSWKVQGIYAVCFFVVCLFTGAERRKKAYLHDGGEEAKKS